VPQLPFVLVDVYTHLPLAGNPLAVVFGADLVPETTLKAIAREFGHSETTFVMQPRRVEAQWRLRCFTPNGDEVFGSGHNAMGAWWALAAGGKLKLPGPRDVFRQELGDNVSAVEIESAAGRPLRIFMQQSPPVFGPSITDRVVLAQALNLDTTDLDVPNLLPQAVSSGAWHLLVPARDRGVLSRARVNAERLVSVARTANCHGCYLFTLDASEPGSTAQARAFLPGIGIAEDPATGSAAGPLTAFLLAHGVVKSAPTVIIEQGDFLSRPSRIHVKVYSDRVDVGGVAVVAGEGAFGL
jgi:trans-2,3-dihydro-3-hydroxyanthranilate isomerase